MLGIFHLRKKKKIESKEVGFVAKVGTFPFYEQWEVLSSEQSHLLRLRVPRLLATGCCCNALPRCSCWKPHDRVVIQLWSLEIRSQCHWAKTRLSTGLRSSTGPREPPPSFQRLPSSWLAAAVLLQVTRGATLTLVSGVRSPWLTPPSLS